MITKILRENLKERKKKPEEGGGKEVQKICISWICMCYDLKFSDYFTIFTCVKESYGESIFCYSIMWIMTEFIKQK